MITINQDGEIATPSIYVEPCQGRSEKFTQWFKTPTRRDGFTSATHFWWHLKSAPFHLNFHDLPSGFKSYSGTMTTIIGEQYQGALWASSRDVLSFEPSAKTRFVYGKNNELKEQSIDLNEIDEIKKLAKAEREIRKIKSTEATTCFSKSSTQVQITKS